MPEPSGSVQVPRWVLKEVIEDGCCPLHVRQQLARALSTDAVPQQHEANSGLLSGDGSGDSGCAAAIAEFLPLEALLSVRATGASVLGAFMQHLPDGRQSSDEESLRPPLASMHDRIRVRLWLQRLEQLTKGVEDERVFESKVRSMMDEALRRRLEGEVAAAKTLMEEEVRAAKANMLQCVQAISDEVDRRVRDKVAMLQDEFDQRAAEHVKCLQELLQQRVTEQTAALRAEVDRRSDLVRAAMEERARAQEEAARCLQEEVARIRRELETRIAEQEETAAQLARELSEVRASFRDLVAIRHALESRVLEQEETARRLSQELVTLKESPGSGSSARALGHLCQGLCSRT